MTPRPLGLASAAALALAVVLSTPAAARTHTVTIEQLRFHPEVLVVARGDRIVWVNRDLFPHNVTAAHGAFDSHGIAANGSWTYRARKAGEYDYHCSYHPTMKARLIVR